MFSILCCFILIELLQNHYKENFLLIDGKGAKLNLYITFGNFTINQFSDNDWLDKNKIQSVQHPFDVSYLDLIIDGDVDLADKVKFSLVNDKGNIINHFEQ